MKTISIIDKTMYNLTADILDIQHTHYRRDKGKNSAIDTTVFGISKLEQAKLSAWSQELVTS